MSIIIFSPPLSVAVKLISSKTFSIIVWSLLAPIFSILALISVATFANVSIPSFVNSKVENIGARRLHTIIERVLDEISFTATDRSGEKINIDANYVKNNLGDIVKDTDLSKFIL